MGHGDLNDRDVSTGNLRASMLSAPSVAVADLRALQSHRSQWVESSRTAFPLCPHSAGHLDERARRASPDQPFMTMRSKINASAPTSSDCFRGSAHKRFPRELRVRVRRGNGLRELSAMKERSRLARRTSATRPTPTIPRSEPVGWARHMSDIRDPDKRPFNASLTPHLQLPVHGIGPPHQRVSTPCKT